MQTNKNIKRLEFDKILKTISKYMPSDRIRENFLNLGFVKDESHLEYRKNRLNEAIKILMKNPSSYGGSVYDIYSALNLCQKGSILSIKELLEISDNLRTHRYLKNYILKTEGDFLILKDKAERIFIFKQIEDKINYVIKDSETINDFASKELFRIRKEIDSKNLKIRDVINSFINDPRYQSSIQESVVTLRNNRYVIPVKSENKRKIKGMIHDKSASGSTVYIEPSELIDINNELSELSLKEQKEIKRILQSLSQMVQEVSQSIKINQKIVDKIFMIFSIAKYSIDTSSHTLKSFDEIYLNNAINPFIDKDEVVPLNIKFGLKDKILIITGPNTGGKTVTLKTIGLFALMNQYGLAVRASSNSTLPFFDHIFVDIGDEQSIEQSLSTFSSHMTNIIDILNKATKRSLLLFDELGAGTDPDEGQALAIAILNKINDIGSISLVSSHYSKVKEYALNNSGFLNASVEFDNILLKPTYKLLIGIPGSSNAIDIAKRLGLDDSIINNAKNYVDNISKNLNKVINEMQGKTKEYQELIDKLNLEKEKYEKNNEKLKNKELDLEERKNKILLDARNKANELYKSNELKVKEIIKSLRKMKNTTVDNKELEDLNKEFLGLKKSEVNINRKINSPKKVRKNDEVYVVGINTSAQALTDSDSNGNFKAIAGIIKMDLNIGEVELRKNKKNDDIIIKKEISFSNVSTKLDLRGKDTIETSLELDRFISSLIVNNIKTAEIVHGKGTYTLSKYVDNYLKKNKFVEDFRKGGYYEGGSGVTIITLK